MKINSCWNRRPYTPLNRPERALQPLICRLAPQRTRILGEILDNGAPDAPHMLLWRERGGETWLELALDGADTFCLDGLREGAEYELCAVRDGDRSCRSPVRPVRCGSFPGTVVNYLHPADGQYAFSGQYLCSPSLLRLPDGALLASMDVYAGGAPQNLTLLFRSENGGASWRYLTDLFPCFWGQLFLCGGRLYMLGVSDEYGDLLIGRSDDGGVSWTAPTVLLRGSSDCRTSGCHRAPMPVLEWEGRIWTDLQYGAWPAHEMDDAVLSAPADCDLLDASNWVCSGFWRDREHFSECAALTPGRSGGIEGSVVACEGGLYDFLRYDRGKWLLLRLDGHDPEAAPVLEDVVGLEATPSKAEVRFDAQSGWFYTVCSRALEQPRTERNLLSLARSRDLRRWEMVCDLLDYRDADPALNGFQYASFLFDGDDLLYLSRTACCGAHNYHNSNAVTFHRLPRFREINPEKNGKSS